MKGSVHVASFTLLYITFIAINFSFCNGDSNVTCLERERDALLIFKQGLVDPKNLLSNWDADEDCCQWAGVQCSNTTGNVVTLYLRNPYPYQEAHIEFMLSGELNPSLLALKQLSYLDLSWNNFTSVPVFLSSLTSLTYLDLSNSYVHGMIPDQLGNLTNLLHLDLASNYLYADSLQWLSRLPSLEYLDLSGANLESTGNWLQHINMLPLLSVLRLSYCGLRIISPSFRHPVQSSNVDSPVQNPSTVWNLCKLTQLDLSGNNFRDQSIGDVINSSSCVWKNLEILSLGNNQLTGHIPEWFGQLRNLTQLSAESNFLYGPIPQSLGNLSRLQALKLTDNLLNGSLPSSLGQLSELMELYIGSNSLEGVMTESHFKNLSQLAILDMSVNAFTLAISDDWNPPFQMFLATLRSIKKITGFPTWLRTQNSLRALDISDTGISGSIPRWFWDYSPTLSAFDFSNNQLSGDLSDVVLNSFIVNLSNNYFTGQLPRLASKVQTLFLSGNSFNGSLSSLLCKNVGGGSDLEHINLSDNLLSGEIPDCFMFYKNLIFVNFASNNLTGKVPASVGALSLLTSLHLQNNSLSGKLPSRLKKCQSLQVIDFGDNMLSGNIPHWMGELTNLKVIRLRSNHFSGRIPQQLCNLKTLQVLDIANNSLKGFIPKCFSKMDAMVSEGTDGVPLTIGLGFDAYVDEMVLVVKGGEWKFTTILYLVRSIDLSSNNLHGEIPGDLSSLHGLRFLNLSGNSLEGTMPREMGEMKSLEALDLSRNHLSGAIPESLAILTMLDFLNLSYNNLSGRIPTSTQLQSFSELSYIGNPGLCGLPLPNECPKGGKSREDEDDDDKLGWSYADLAAGFVTGFVGVCAFLFFKRNWRNVLFRFLDDLVDDVYAVLR